MSEGSWSFLNLPLCYLVFFIFALKLHLAMKWSKICQKMKKNWIEFQQTMTWRIFFMLWVVRRRRRKKINVQERWWWWWGLTVYRDWIRHDVFEWFHGKLHLYDGILCRQKYMCCIINFEITSKIPIIKIV